MSENIEKRIKTVRTLFLILITITILGGLGLYDSYKEHNDLFVFSSIGLLTFVAIFYNMVYSTDFIRVSDLVTKSIDKKVESKKKSLIQLAKEGNFKKLREESTKIEDIVGGKKLVDVKFWLFYGVICLLIAIPSLLLISIQYIGAAYFMFWLGYVGVVQTVLLWYFVYS